MKTTWLGGLLGMVLAGGLFVAPRPARAHCDAVDGPVATAAVRALETGNVSAVLPYVPPATEGELTAVFERAVVVRGQGPEAKALADRHFMETAVRLHRAGEGAPFTGLRAPGTDFGPAIPAAERALETGQVEPLVRLIAREASEGIAHRFEQAAATRGASREPRTAAEVPAARARVRAELEFIGYVEAVYQAIRGGGHAEGHAR